MSNIGYERAKARRAREGQPALFPGICRCGDRWAIGDLIARRGNKWQHAACARRSDDE